MNIIYTKEMKWIRFWYHWSFICMLLTTFMSVYHFISHQWGWMILFIVLTWTNWNSNNFYTKLIANKIDEQIAEQEINK